jgi:predicted DsbA family dithiol-disulfide isomerase
VGGVPIGWFGLAMGALIALGALFPSARLVATNRTLSLLNVIGVVVLFLYSVLGLGSLCLLCSGYYILSFVVFGLFWATGRIEGGGAGLWLRPSILHLGVFGALMLLGAWGVADYHGVRREAQVGGVAARVVSQYYSLPSVPWPSEVSAYWSVKSTDDFEDTPIRVVEFGDPLCADCQLLHGQLKRLAEEFPGRVNVAFQFFPLEAECNDVVDKDKHPGACELSYMLAARPADFHTMLDEVFENMRAAEEPSWRADFAVRWGVDVACDDPDVRARVHRLTATGAEYEKTSDDYAYGIRSTPTMIINNRMVIGTLPYEQLKAIFQALDDEAERGSAGFIEGWEPTEG